MDIFTACEVAFNNGYNKASKELREETEWNPLNKTEYQCSKCKIINSNPSKFCPNCGRIAVITSKK